jgi:hypothetical protein
MKLLESEFDKLLSDFKSEIKKIKFKPSYALLGSALMKSRYLIVGNNWGGNSESPVQTEMPLVNDILVEPNNPTYKGYLAFFGQMFDYKWKLINFLSKSVYTNGNFIRTPNESKKYKDQLEKGRLLSHAFLKQIIDYVNPDIIICFGNGEASGTNSVFEALGEKDKFWKRPDIQTVPAGKWSTYKFDLYIGKKKYLIYSFPHASKYQMWKDDIQDNKFFKEIQAKAQRWP